MENAPTKIEPVYPRLVELRVKCAECGMMRAQYGRRNGVLESDNFAAKVTSEGWFMVAGAPHCPICAAIARLGEAQEKPE